MLENDPPYVVFCKNDSILIHHCFFSKKFHAKLWENWIHSVWHLSSKENKSVEFNKPLFEMSAFITGCFLYVGLERIRYRFMQKTRKFIRAGMTVHQAVMYQQRTSQTL